MSDELATEAARADSAELDALPLAAALDLFDRADEEVHVALKAARPAIEAAIELVTARLARGGRLIYVGAGTSGRLGLLDASECPPTFHTRPEEVQGRIAGGPEAFFRAVEGAEDSTELGRAAVEDVGANDVVFGIAASGRTPWVHGALARAKERGAATVLLACVPFEQAPDAADVSIRVVTGPEVLTGSTRLKAGTATKLVLNRVTTLAFTRLGRVHGNRMIDLDARANAKLRRRALGILRGLTGLDEEPAAALLARAEGRVKPAALMQLAGLSQAEALAALARHGSLRRALAATRGA
ncbi:MAG TPA: N-acetylmuramic acid 6-phosphate etherase [Planctomycetota bacterium]